MLKHNETGVKGEQIAQDFLKNKGYNILETNWRFGKKEVDIIADDGKCLVFVEVKTRSAMKLLFPEEAVTKAKQNYIYQAAIAFTHQRQLESSFRFDIISIWLQGGALREIVHFENAF
jgi:putative endonuclease